MKGLEPPCLAAPDPKSGVSNQIAAASPKQNGNTLLKSIPVFPVRMKGLEPPCLAAPDPKSGVSNQIAAASPKQNGNTLLKSIPVFRVRMKGLEPHASRHQILSLACQIKLRPHHQNQNGNTLLKSIPVFPVRMKGLEPPCLAAPDPKSGVSNQIAAASPKPKREHPFKEYSRFSSADEGTRTPMPRGTRS